MRITARHKVSALPRPRDDYRASPTSANGVLTVSAHLAQPGTVVLTARGEVDMSTAPHLREHLQEQIHHAGPDLVLDLTGVTFFGGAGLTVLVHVRNAASLAEIDFRVVACTRVVLVPLRITGMDAVLDVHPDLASTPMRPWLPIGRR